MMASASWCASGPTVSSKLDETDAELRDRAADHVQGAPSLLPLLLGEGDAVIERDGAAL
jgi:hypothetical protein